MFIFPEELSRTMKKIALIALSLIFLLPSLALSESAFRVAYVDMQKALESSNAGKLAQKSYEKEVKGAQQEIDKMKKEFERKRESFEKQKGSLNEVAFAEKKEELLSIERDVKRSFQDSQAKLRRKNASIVSELIKELKKTVSDIGSDKDYTVILEKGSQAVLYADNSIDITDEVIDRFNDQMKGKKF
jgi:outer membrane protein